jgi:hypothetical protein
MEFDCETRQIRRNAQVKQQNACRGCFDSRSISSPSVTVCLIDSSAKPIMSRDCVLLMQIEAENFFYEELAHSELQYEDGELVNSSQELC